MPRDRLIIYATDQDGIATLTLNRPDKLNAFTGEMIELWLQSLLAAKEDPSVRILVLTGAGKAFCAGGDAGAMETISRQDALFQKNSLWRNVHRIALTLESFDKPVIAAINGTARGAGLDMALMCDIRMMAQSATLAQSYINMGLITGNGGTYYLPRLVGIDRALELFWTGRMVSSAEAERIGMVTRVVPDNELLDATYDLAREIALQPLEAVRAYKRATYQGRDMSLQAHLDMIYSHQVVLRQLPEHIARVEAFLSRKK